MSKDFINNDTLATIDELQYMLIEVLGGKEPVALNDLSRLCKERSLNFAFTFENTLNYLQLVDIIKINSHKSFSRNNDYDSDTSDLSALLLKKTISYLKKRKIVKKIFNSDTLTIDAKSDTCLVHFNKIPSEYPFIKVFLLNTGIAELTENSQNQLIISKHYKSHFIDNTPEGEIVIKPGKKPTFFISYAHADENHKEQLKNHLSGLVNQGIIESWDGRAILPGEDWDAEVKKKLEQAEVVMFLISSDFMASTYINDVEIKKTIERHARNEVKIIPVLVRPCDYTSLPIGKYQMLPTDAKAINEWDNKDAAYLNVVSEIKRTLKKM